MQRTKHPKPTMQQNQKSSMHFHLTILIEYNGYFSFLGEVSLVLCGEAPNKCDMTPMVWYDSIAASQLLRVLFRGEDKNQPKAPQHTQVYTHFFFFLKVYISFHKL